MHASWRFLRHDERMPTVVWIYQGPFSTLDQAWPVKLEKEGIGRRTWYSDDIRKPERAARWRTT